MLLCRMQSHRCLKESFPMLLYCRMQSQVEITLQLPIFSPAPPPPPLWDAHNTTQCHTTRPCHTMPYQSTLCNAVSTPCHTTLYHIMVPSDKRKHFVLLVFFTICISVFPVRGEAGELEVFTPPLLQSIHTVSILLMDRFILFVLLYFYTFYTFYSPTANSHKQQLLHHCSILFVHFY